MREHLSAWLGVVGIILTSCAAIASAQPHPWTPPLTADGHPDLQGIWVDNSATPLERPAALRDKTVLSDDEVKELERRARRLFSSANNSDYPPGDNYFLALLNNPDRFKSPTATDSSDAMIPRPFESRTSLVSDPPDGRIPALTPEGTARVQAWTKKRTRPDPDDPEDLSNERRCITFGTPRVGGTFGAGPYGYYQVVQTPNYFVLTTEFAHEARIVPLDGRPHLPAAIRAWNGDSRGRWEGTTLVVDTTNFSPNSIFQGSTDGLHLVERFTRVAGDTLLYEVTIEDAQTWVRPWTAIINLHATSERLFEVACHEGNYYSMQGVLAGTRAAEKSAAETPVKKH
jgi:hypothetical protein